MPAQHSERGSTVRIPDGDQLISAPTDYSCTVWAPIDIIERDSVALHGVDAPSTSHVPDAQGAIFTTTDQVTALRRKGKIEYVIGMPMQRGPIATSLDIPQPDCFVITCAG